MLEATTEPDATSRALKRMIIADGYTVDVRQMAYDRMKIIDPEGLQRLLEIQDLYPNDRQVARVEREIQRWARAQRAVRVVRGDAAAPAQGQAAGA